MKNLKDTPKSLIFGLVVGDAMGVPVEFMQRNELRKDPVVGMRGYGTYNMPPGTFSDDSSLSLCLASSLLGGFDPEDIAHMFMLWKEEGYWSADGTVFDIGIATNSAIKRIKDGYSPEKCGMTDEHSNGNGSLMRIAPLIFHIMDNPPDERYQLTRIVSSITHAHPRSVIGCFYYLEFIGKILKGVNKFEAYRQLQNEIPSYGFIDPVELSHYARLLRENIYRLPDSSINSSGYIVHTLEASLWCILTSDNYRDAVLEAVNLGEDTDTTATVTGAIAGLLYGYDDIPSDWIQQLARKKDICELAESLSRKYIGS